MDNKIIVYMFNSVNNCNKKSCNGTSANLIQEFNNMFNIKIAFGGNAANFGCAEKKSLDDFFLTKDVVNLAMTSYLKALA